MSKSNIFAQSEQRLVTTLRGLPQPKREAEYKLIDEVDVLHAHGALYYRHEDGVVFTIDLSELDSRLVELRMTEHVPDDAEPFDLIAGSGREASVDAWTEACDKQWKRSAFA